MKKSIVFTIFFSLLFVVNFVLVKESFATGDVQLTIEQLQVKIKILQKQINELKAQSATTQEGSKSEIQEVRFTKMLYFGISGDEVKKLQEFLKTMPGIYPEGLITGYFGSLTKAAVKRFQEAHGIEIVGVVGPKTLAKMNELFQSTSGDTNTTPEKQKQEPVPVPPTTPAIPVTPPVSEQLSSPTSQPPIATTSTCTDTDGGKDYFVRGIGTYTAGYTAIGYNLLTDYCDATDILKLYEAYCSNDGYVYSQEHICPTGCFNGACGASASSTSSGY